MNAHEARLRAVERKVDDLTNQMARVVDVLESMKGQGGGNVNVGAAETWSRVDKPEAPAESPPPPRRGRGQTFRRQTSVGVDASARKFQHSASGVSDAPRNTAEMEARFADDISKVQQRLLAVDVALLSVEKNAVAAAEKRATAAASRAIGEQMHGFERRLRGELQEQIYELFHRANHPSSASQMESFEAFELSGSIGSRRLSPSGRNTGTLPMRQLIGQHPSMAVGGMGGLDGQGEATVDSWGREEGDDYSQYTVMPKFKDENSQVSFLGENEFGIGLSSTDEVDESGFSPSPQVNTRQLDDSSEQYGRQLEGGGGASLAESKAYTNAATHVTGASYSSHGQVSAKQYPGFSPAQYSNNHQRYQHLTGPTHSPAAAYAAHFGYRDVRSAQGGSRPLSPTERTLQRPRSAASSRHKQVPISVTRLGEGDRTRLG